MQTTGKRPTWQISLLLTCESVNCQIQIKDALLKCLKDEDLGAIVLIGLDPCCHFFPLALLGAPQIFFHPSAFRSQFLFGRKERKQFRTADHELEVLLEQASLTGACW